MLRLRPACTATTTTSTTGCGGTLAVAGSTCWVAMKRCSLSRGTTAVGLPGSRFCGFGRGGFGASVRRRDSGGGAAQAQQQVVGGQRQALVQQQPGLRGSVRHVGQPAQAPGRMA